MWLFDCAVFRQLEKLSDLFEKLRVSGTFCSNAWRLCKYLSVFCKHFVSVWAPSEGGRKGSFRPGAEAHRAAEVLHERHPGCQGETRKPVLSLRCRSSSHHRKASTVVHDVTLIQGPDPLRWGSSPLIIKSSQSPTATSVHLENSCIHAGPIWLIVGVLL